MKENNSQRLEHKLQQRQELVPQLIELLKILQIPRLELEQLIRHEIEENPFLDEELIDEEEEIEKEAEKEEEGFQFDEMDFDYFFHEEWKNTNYDFSRKTKENEEFNPIDIYSAPDLLKDHLILQSHITFKTVEEIQIAEFIISSLKDDGFLDNEKDESGKTTLEYIMEVFNVSEEKLESILKTIRNFDPIGIASRDVRECFLTQLEYNNQKDSIAYEIVNKFFEEFMSNKLYLIKNKTKYTDKQLNKAIEIIKSLNPKPACGSWGKSSNYIIPDIIIERKGDDFIATLNSTNIPEVHINKRYYNLLKGKNNLSKKEKRFLKERLQKAFLLVSGIHKRNSTLLKIAERIIMLQKEFFLFGVSALKPMILLDISEYLNIHESTVSRAIENKYVDTPQGLFPFKFFFTRGVSTEQGIISSLNVKDLIKNIIDNEDKSKPLTDNLICEKLKQEYKINIARRTIAKYRKQLNILSASKRKQYFKEA